MCGDSVAEVSLLGALGCGRQLLQLLIDELETGDKYDYLVLQATDNAIGFYEKMGFTRVGAVSKPDEEAVAAQMAEAQRQREAKALLRERQRQNKLADKDTVKGERERLLVEAGKQQSGVWREACREVLQRLLESSHASKIAWPKALPDDQVAKNLVSARAALDEASKAQARAHARKYRDTEHFVRDIKRLLQLTMAPHTIGDHVYDECARLLQLFKAEWRHVGEHAAACDADSKRYFIYVDLMWEPKQHFRLFELHGAVEHKSASKAYASAREYRVATEAESPGKFEANRLRMLARNPKPQKLLWTARRDLQGMTQSECMCVKVAPADAVAQSDDGGALVVEDQAKMVALAYARLHALRALLQEADAPPDDAPAAAHETQHEAADAPGASAPDISGMGEESDMSEYELARLRRMQENARLLESTGIMSSIATQVKSLAPQDSKETGSPAKKKRARARESAEEGEVNVRSLRSKVQHESVPSKVESEDKSSLSDVDTPLKYEGAPPPQTHAGQATQQQQAMQHEHAALELAEAAHGQPDCEPGAGAGEEEARRTAEAEAAGEATDNGKAGGMRQADKDAAAGAVAARPFPPDACYVAKEDDTPRIIAKMFGLDLQCLVKLNKGQYPTLTANSRLRKATQLRLPNPGDRDVFIPASKLNEKGEGWVAYCHWTFPDQKVEDMTASYMMVRRLQRRSADTLPPDSMLKVLGARKAAVPPRTKSAVELLEEAAQPARLHRPEGWPDKDEYTCQEDDRPVGIAKKLGVDADQLVVLNRALYPTLNKTVPLKAGTRLRLPPPLSAEAGAVERAAWWQPAMDIVTKLKKMRQADPFLTPVDWEEMGLVEYPFIISQPMDLSTVEEKLLCSTYVSAAQVERDLRLIFDNAMHFNQPEDAVHQMAGKLLKLFSSLWAQAKLGSSAAATVSLCVFGLPISTLILSAYRHTQSPSHPPDTNARAHTQYCIHTRTHAHTRARARTHTHTHRRRQAGRRGAAASRRSQSRCTTRWSLSRAGPRAIILCCTISRTCSGATLQKWAWMGSSPRPTKTETHTPMQTAPSGSCCPRGRAMSWM